MSKCSHCETSFKFIDVLKGFNPASIKCSGCTERIKSSYITLAITSVIYLALLAALLSLPFPYSEASNTNSGAVILVVMLALGLLFEVVYFKLLATGIIKSNLNHER